MNYNKIVLTIDNFSKGGAIIATDIKPAYEYKDGHRQDKVVGQRVSVVFPGNQYDTLTVTVSDPVDRLSEVLKQGSPVYIAFQNFSARFYVIENRVGVSAKADSVTVVDDLDDIEIG